MAFANVLKVVCALAVMATAFAKGGRRMEIMIPTRDDVYLHTLINLPKESEDGPNKFPTVVDRSPYGYGDMEWLTNIFLPFGFAAVGQDMRGTELSQGNFSMWTSDGNDSQDLGDWIVQQPWSNGEIYTFGASADGIGSMQTPRNNPPWLTAQYIAWAPAYMYQILFPFGTYKQETTEQWLHGLTMPNPEVVDVNIELVHINEAHTDFWTLMEMSPEVFSHVRAKNAFWAGWYDLFLMGNLQAFDGYNTMSDPSVRYTTMITIDPLGHCLEGAEFFTQNAVEGRTLVVLGQLLETYGIHPVVRTEVKNVTFYVMSSNDEAGLAAGQYWTSMETFPTPKMMSYYLHADKTASMAPPLPSENPSTSYKYDPADPVPTMGGNNLPDSIGGSIPCGPLDQSVIDQRADVLTFQTTPFEEILALTGPLLATLYVSSDAIDTDFMVRISDVYPTGEARLLQDNAVRMRWREGGLTPVYMEKDQVYQMEMNLWNTSYIFAPGHSLRVAVTSSNNPRFSVNPNNGLLLKDPLYPGQNITATNTLFHSSKYPSKVVLPVVSKHMLPEVHVLKEVRRAYPQLTDEAIAKFSVGLENHMKTAYTSKK